MISTRLKEIRMQRNYTQKEIAEVLNITREAYCMYETGARKPHYEVLLFLADFYNISMDYLFERETFNGEFLSEKEKSLIEIYRNSDERGKETLLRLAHYEAEITKNYK